MTDGEFLSRFEDGSLPFDQWTHRAHVKIAFLYLRDNSLPVATEKIRDGIKAYNAAHHVPEGPLMGYNETTTIAFLHLVDCTMSVYGKSHPASDAEAFCDAHPQLMSKHVLRLFYSPERRADPAAKTQFIEPDLAPSRHVPRSTVADITLGPHKTSDVHRGERDDWRRERVMRLLTRPCRFRQVP